MNLSPVDVEQKAFTQALRGYQMDEVDDFLDEVVTALRSYEQRLKDSQEKIRALEADVANRGGDEGAISRAFVAAQRSADAMVAEAEAEAEKIRQRAIAETDELSSRRDAERSRVLSEIAGMRERMVALRDRLTELTNAIAREMNDIDSELIGTEADLGTQDVSTPASESEVADLSDMNESEVTSGAHPTADLDDEDEGSEPSLIEDSASRLSSRPWERG